jgi:hypothetical protein
LGTQCAGSDKKKLTAITRYGILGRNREEFKKWLRRAILRCVLRVKEEYYIKKINEEQEVKDMKKLIFVAAMLTVVAFAFGALAVRPAPAADSWFAAVGVLQKIDAAAKAFEFKKIVQPKGKKAIETMMTFATNDKTKIFKLDEKLKEKKLSFDYLKTGQTLWITYRVEGGKNIAITIEVRP